MKEKTAHKKGARFKKGAASFYIVAFSTLILMIVAISFAAVIISEVERTSNDDLSQSAYDSALAGIEDAKLAYHNYQNCLIGGSSGGDCEKVVAAMTAANDSANYANESNCNMVWEMLGRNTSSGGNVLEQNTTSNNMQQEVTCLTMTDELPDYKSSLTSSSPIDVVKVRFKIPVAYENLSAVRLKWYSAEDAARDYADNSSKLSFGNSSGSSVRFPSYSIPVSAPPTIAFAMVQTGERFNMQSFEKTSDGKTDRGTLFLVPSGTSGVTSIGADKLVKSNDKTIENKPFVVKCADKVSSIEEYACSIEIGMPRPFDDGERNRETLEYAIMIPYGQPKTDFALEFYCGNNVACSDGTSGGSGGKDTATLKGVQLRVDSTGRANDLYRRVETRMKNRDNSFSMMGALELVGDGGGLFKGVDGSSYGLDAGSTVTSEYNF